MPGAAPVASKTVIVADDTSFVRDRFKAALQSAGHDARGVASAAELLARVRGNSVGVDLIVLDLRLPRANGLAIVRALRSIDGFRAPIVVFSGTIAHAREVRELAQLGVAGYVSEYSSVRHIAPALAPHLYPDRHGRRSSARVSVAVPVTYRVGNLLATAVTLNVGSGGVAIRTASPLGRDATVRVRFRLPTTAADTGAEAVVVWTDRRVGMGLRFTLIDAADQASVDDFVRSHFFSNRKA